VTFRLSPLSAPTVSDIHPPGQEHAVDAAHVSGREVAVGRVVGLARLCSLQAVPPAGTLSTSTG
jgi:hypothetical protein